MFLTALVVLGLLSAGVALGSFSRATSNGFSIATDRVFPGQRTSSVWSMIDSGDGSASNISSSTSFTDGSAFTTGNWSNAFSSTRYFEVAYANPLPGGVSVSSVEFDFTFAANNAADTACYYIEVYKESTSTLLATHGSSGSPVACVTGTTQTATTVSLPEITSSDQANDLRVRIYAKDSGNRALLIDLATVIGASYSNFTLYNLLVRDRSTGTQTTSAGGLVTSGDGTTLTSTAWANAFSATRYFSMNFLDWMPTDAAVSAFDFQLKYHSGTNGSNACWYLEVYNYSNVLIGTHGSSASTISCNSSNTTFATDTVSLPEVNTGIEGNSLLLKLYFKSSGSSTVVFDNAQIRSTWSLGTGTGCASPGLQVIDASADTYVDQGSANTNFGTVTTASVQSRSGSRNRRMLVDFPLPAEPVGCSVTLATLKVTSNTASASTRTMEAAQVASAWGENAVTWNTKPTTTGTPATTSSGATTQSWTVTSMVQSMIAGNAYGFQIKDQTEDSATAQTQSYRTTEGLTSIPQLEVTFG